MRVNRLVPALFLFVLPAFATLACGHDSTAPATPKTGAIEITVMTVSTIGEVDTTKYSVSVDNGPWQLVGVPTRVKVGGLTRSTHRILLTGFAAHCYSTSDNPLVVDLDPDLGTLLVTFSVSCDLDGSGPWDY